MEINNRPHVIHGFDLPEQNLGRQYELIDQYETAWRDWLALNKFEHAIPTNGIVESIEKICSSKDFTRFVIIENEVKFYQLILDHYNQNYRSNPLMILEYHHFLYLVQDFLLADQCHLN